MIKTHLLLVYLLLLGSSYAQNSSTVEYAEAKKTYEQFLVNHSHTIITKNSNLHYLSWGKDTQPALFWLHGSYSNALEIEPFVEKLTSHGYRVIAIDYYGHGRTPYSSSRLSLTNLLEDIHTLAQQLQLEKINIGGFSRGAYIATSYYNKYPDQVNSLILEDGGVNPFLGHLQKMTEEELEDFFQAETANRPKELFERYDTELEAYQAIKNYSDTVYTERYKNFSFILFNQHKYSIYAGIDTLYGMDSYASLSRLMKKNLRSNPFANQLMKQDYANIIQNIDVPTLLLEARSQDDLFDDAGYYQVYSFSNSKIEHKIFEHSNHNIHFSEPEEFITTIINFLNTQQYDHTRSTGNRR